ncbi:MAG: large repetitive protein, partial [Thermoleophilaceae bacterium]|nr:large repetitive protein [Thermoleophilaceae bacterium]
MSCRSVERVAQRAVGIAAVVLALAGVGAAPALAGDNGDGTYSIAACAGASGAQNSWEHSLPPSSGMFSYSNCSATNATGAVSVGAAVEPGAVSGFSNAEAHIRAASGTHFRGASLTYGGYSNSSLGWSSWIAATDDPGFGFSGNWGSPNKRWLDGCTAGAFCVGFGGDNRYFDIDGAKALQIMSICSNTTCGRGSTGTAPYSQSWLNLYSAGLWIADEQDPTLGGARGSITGGGWKRDDVDAIIDLADNVGVKKVAFAVDDVDNLVRDFTSECDYTRVVPCRNHSGEGFRLNTAGLRDGRHVWQVGVRDAASRTALGPKFEFFTDNHAPDAPSKLAIDGGENWAPPLSRTIHWALPGAAGGSPVTHAQVRMCKGTDCREYGFNGTNIDAADIGAFDGPGDYTVRVYLRDEAGNESAANVSDPVHLRFDNVAPGAAEPRNANGWLNAVERAAYRQPLQLVDGGFVPVSGIKGYSLTVNGDDPDATIEAAGDPVEYPMSELPEGVNVVKARAVSGAGLSSTTVKSATVRVDLTPPEARVEDAPSATRWQHAPVSLALAGVDQAGLSGMGGAELDHKVEDGAYIAYRIDGGDLQKVRGGEAPVTVGDEGEHTISYYAVDFAGNQSEAKTVQFKIDRTSPTASAQASVAPDVWQADPVTVAITGDDGNGHSGMDPAPGGAPLADGAYVAYQLDGGAVETAAGGSTTVKVDADGDHVVRYYA